VCRLTPAEYESLVHGPFVAERLLEEDLSLLVVEGAAHDLSDPGSLPVVVAAIASDFGGAGPAAADLVVDEAHLALLTDTVERNPIAAVSLAVLLRTIERLPVELGLAAESATYSMLQGGAEFARWRGATEPALANDAATVLVDRIDDHMEIVLDRPERHNAISRQLRDELCLALELALLDNSITSVRLTGRAPSFCSGGDLTEFGSRPDPAVAHRVRLAQSPALLVHRLQNRLGDQLSVHLHGATLGGGLELAAFASRVTADPATRIGLPEVRLGLIPGAGGTVSITGRIGRRRTAALALACDTIDAPTALRWGLVDELVTTSGE
jgi:enoyl-CoA hydratase/carnithine racemase